MASKYSDEVVKEVFRLHHEDDKNQTYISRDLNIPRSTVQALLKNPTYQRMWFGAEHEEFVEVLEDPACVHSNKEPDEELVEENLKLAKRVQTLLDKNRIQNKSFREFVRVDQMLLSQTEALVKLLQDRTFKFQTKNWMEDEVFGVDRETKYPIGVIQFSDHHINEVVEDLSSNKFDVTVASKRIYKHVEKSLKYFSAFGVEHVLIAMTGDLIKNAQFISEITENSLDRANATILAVELYAQAILHINDKGYNVTLAGVVGNESRIAKDFDTTTFLASESFDLMILKMLQYVFVNCPGITIVPMENPLECVVNVAGSNLLLVHGNAHGRLSNNGSIEKGVEVLKARYGSYGVKIDYVIMGHIHSAYVGDNFARSSGLPGSNPYSERTLNLNGKASQNSYIFWPDGSIDGIKVDLQNVEGYKGYELDKAMTKLAIKPRNAAHTGTMKVIASYVV